MLSCTLSELVSPLEHNGWLLEAPGCACRASSSYRPGARIPTVQPHIGCCAGAADEGDDAWPTCCGGSACEGTAIRGDTEWPLSMRLRQ